MIQNVLPAPRWVCLRTTDGKLLARFDRQRGLLEIVHRGEMHLFDLLQACSEAPSDSTATLLVVLTPPEGLAKNNNS